MKRAIIIMAVVAVAATVLTGCEDDPWNNNERDKQGRLIEISGVIDVVYARKSTPDPGDSPQQRYELEFGDLDPDSYTIHMCVEKEIDGELALFDIAQANVSKHGTFTLMMPETVQADWLEKAPDRIETLLENSGIHHLDFELDDMPDEIEISNPDADICIAKLFMERAGDGQRFEISYGGFHKESYHVTDLSNVASSSLLYTSAEMEITGRADIELAMGEFSYGYPTFFEVNSRGKWSWLHCIVNGMAGSCGWTTSYPDWAIMTYTASETFEDQSL